MITPRFTCSQTYESVVVSVYCPSIRAADVEIHVDANLLSLHVNPYFLRLTFSHSLLEDDASSANYNPTSGYLTITLTKENKGQEFQDLDLLTRLLAPRKTKAGPMIEALPSEDNDEDKLDSAVENDWQLPQQLTQDLPSLETSVQKYYGFLNLHSGYFRHVTHTENEVNELGTDVESCPASERRRLRIQHEDDKWDEEYYMADYADDEYIQELLDWVSPKLISNEDIQYTDEEKETMLRLPRKEYLASPLETHNIYLTLITLLFSYTYDSRTTQSDPTPESAWTICSLTPAFSALDPPNITTKDSRAFVLDEVTEILISSYRRVLAFPLYRSFALAEACQKDVARILCKGQRLLIRCLLEMKQILDHHEVYYVYSKIWVDDFCSWVQSYASDETLQELGELMSKAKVAKSSIGWDLEELEAATLEATNREADSDDE
ncbi:hypothetical protein AGABI2DRAFT_183517 [Agaricus bisporus var. bisporus H97]|uniref:hypothetical protein n=1 Tax=Agaricus bisporus var. bisporus (strain H97 / ATCC MYA-4626 / FGSC 10389) TaxID=936046 RepID=UPI00029F5944|nr:hypothetical protein AGABI2DRAFT_183517 [Agaricus bisporus var. bisporus H97]EKV50437.1 hypothetical protein AGABI2DRAFT_183517 [Agaricus bisporus var. bisporus H97]